MIVTLTVNPSIDRTIALDAALEPGEVQRAAGMREDPGGKGVNVARVVAAAGSEALAVVPVESGDPYRALLDAAGVPVLAVPGAARVRANLTITDPDGVTTKLNLPGAVASEALAHAIREQVVTASRGATWLVLAGSLPPGLPDDFYATLIADVRARWGDEAPRIAVDASGAPLAAVVASAHPDLIKPNELELAEISPDVGGDGPVDAVALDRARRLVPDRVGAALVTLGADGALLVTADGALRAWPPRIRAASTVGAGDSSLAGYLLADIAGADDRGRLANSVAYGAAAASLPGTQPPLPDQLPRDAVRVAHASPSH